MAACSLGGISNVKLLNFQLESKRIAYAGLVTPTPYKAKYNRPKALYCSKRTQIRHKPVHAAGNDKQPSRLNNSLVVSCSPSSRAKSELLDISSEEKKSTKNKIVPATVEVQSLLTTICDTASIAEVELNLAGFHLYVKRDLVEKTLPPPPPSPPLIQTNASNQAPDLNGSAAGTSLTISKPKPASGGIQSVLDAASDEGLVILQSPKVGFFRKSRTIKGKRAPPSCKEKQEVKEGQVLCYIEQLGGEIPIESDVSGEVIKILRDDGEPVGYGDALIAILPSFPGIKKL